MIGRFILVLPEAALPRPQAGQDARRFHRSVVVIQHLAILAPGLLGSSVARAARERGLANRITVWARRAEVRAELRGQPWVDDVADTPGAAVAEASLVVLAAPVDRIIDLDQEIAPRLATSAIVTDVGSVKGPICAAAARHPRPSGACFIGSHPMAGSEKTGWEHGLPSLFEKRVCFVTPSDETPAEALHLLENFWRALGAEVVVAAPAKHDEIVAHISHLPQAVATSLACALATKDGDWRHLAGNGLRDTTRIAAGDASMWVEIFQQNRTAVLEALARQEEELSAFRLALERSDWAAIRARLERGKAWRDGFRT
jgi:cyclohexadieny/prephenate dehydrogenase